MTVIAPNTQTVGQPLTLTCNVTTVRGITSQVDIVWRREGRILRNKKNISLTTMITTSLVFIDRYTTSPLGTSDDGRQYECRLVVRSPEVVRVTDTFTLDVTGMYYKILPTFYSCKEFLWYPIEIIKVTCNVFSLLQTS